MKWNLCDTSVIAMYPRPSNHIKPYFFLLNSNAVLNVSFNRSVVEGTKKYFFRAGSVTDSVPRWPVIIAELH